VLLGLAWGCSASSERAPGLHPSGGGGSGIGEAGMDGQVIRSDGSSDAGQGSLELDPLCGRLPGCIPDQPGACNGYQPPKAPPEDASIGTEMPVSNDATIESGVVDQNSSSGGAGNEGGEAGVGGAADRVALESAGAGGSAGAKGVAGSGGEGGMQTSQFSCQVLREVGAARSAVAACAPAGTGQINDPCLSSSDCGWDDQRGALGCVGDAHSGLCQPYCCRGNDSCGEGSYCAERPLRDALTNAGSAGTPTVMIPVCVPAENCDLATPYPCPSGKACACGKGSACLVVRADGTTTCAVPGKGVAGDACPCAWGYVCSLATDQCLKLCYTRDSGGCGDGACQSSADLPDGWGVCVGTELPVGG
jgi:hypothetical protein